MCDCVKLHAALPYVSEALTSGRAEPSTVSGLLLKIILQKDDATFTVDF